MDTFLGIVLLWIAISLPFLFLAYSIFLVRENRKHKYGSVYVKAAISFGIFLLVCLTYYLLPGFFKPASADLPNGKEQGLFVNRRTKDTIELKFNVMSIRHGADDGQPIASGVYSIYRPKTNGLSVEAANLGLTREPMLLKLVNHFNTSREPDPVLEWNYTVKDLSKQKITGNKNRRQKTNYPNYRHETVVFNMEFAGNNLKLTPKGYTGSSYGAQLLERIN